MLRRAALVVCDRLVWIALGVIVGAAATALTHAQSPLQPPSQSQPQPQPQPPAPSQPSTQPPAPAQQAQSAPPPRIFAGDAGLVLNFIKPDKTKDFEAIVAKVKDALVASTSDQRKEQARGWRVFKAGEPAAGGAALYVFFVDPPVKNADYALTSVLGEALTAAEMTAVSKQYVESYASGQNFVNLTLVADFGK